MCILDAYNMFFSGLSFEMEIKRCKFLVAYFLSKRYMHMGRNACSYHNMYVDMSIGHAARLLSIYMCVCSNSKKIHVGGLIIYMGWRCYSDVGLILEYDIHNRLRP